MARFAVVVCMNSMKFLIVLIGLQLSLPALAQSECFDNYCSGHITYLEHERIYAFTQSQEDLQQIKDHPRRELPASALRIYPCIDKSGASALILSSLAWKLSLAVAERQNSAIDIKFRKVRFIGQCMEDFHMTTETEAQAAEARIAN